MDELKTKAGNLTDHVSDYIETYVKLTVVNATQKATGVASVSLIAVLVTFFFIFVFFFVGLGAGIWIGEALDDVKLGYFIVSAFYLVCALIVIAIRKKIVFPYVRNQIISKVYE